MELFKTAFFMVALMLLFVFIGGMIGGVGGMMIAFCIAVAMNFFSYFFSDKLVLKQYNAKEATSQSAPELYQGTITPMKSSHLMSFIVSLEIYVIKRIYQCQNSI